MATLRPHTTKGWLDEAIRHLDVLCKEAHTYIDEGDIPPTSQGISSAKEFMAEVSNADMPQIILTVNGEVLISWQIAQDNLMARASRDGGITFYKNKVILDSSVFMQCLITRAA